MAMKPHCDRCQAADVQVVQVVGKDLCNVCVRDLKSFLSTPPLRDQRTRSARTDQAMACARRGQVSARTLAGVNQEPYRKAYFTLMGLARAGRLVHRGEGIFTLPVWEAAE